MLPGQTLLQSSVCKDTKNLWGTKLDLNFIISQPDSVQSTIQGSILAHSSRQPHIDDELHKIGIPLTHFETIVKAQKSNDVRLIHGNQVGKAAR